MDVMEDPNIIYGGDVEDEDDEIVEYASLGDYIVKQLKLGYNRTSFVSEVA